MNRETSKSCFCFFTDGKQHESREVDMITLRNHGQSCTVVIHDMITGHGANDYQWPWVSLTWLLCNLQLWRHRRWFQKFTVHFRSIRKELESSMYNKFNYWVSGQLTPDLQTTSFSSVYPLLSQTSRLIYETKTKRHTNYSSFFYSLPSLKIGGELSRGRVVSHSIIVLGGSLNLQLINFYLFCG